MGTTQHLDVGGVAATDTDGGGSFRSAEASIEVDATTFADPRTDHL